MAATLSKILNSHRTHAPIVMGILNATPDSFSDGGQFDSPAAALDHARRMIDEGADLLDLGAESTRPGSQRVNADEQIRRLRPLLPAVVKLGVPVSIDTTRDAVARFALDSGAALLNDISAGREEPALLATAAQRRCPIVLMHMVGQPADMQNDPQYRDVVGEVRTFLLERVAAATAAGIPRENILLDPGIGFGKGPEHNLALLRHTDALAELGFPLLIGASRKRFLGQLTGQTDPAARLHGTVAACLESYRLGATIFRVHDVGPVRQALAVARAIQGR